jgi:DNA-entry nuclease
MGRRSKKERIWQYILSVILLVVIAAFGYTNLADKPTNETASVVSFDLASIPEYSDSAYVVLNNNVPDFDESDYTTESFEEYSELDSLGRCGVAFANICKETMPKEDDERESISSVKPSGWVQKKYNGEYLYNRCHLIGYQLTNENANKQNLITGTVYLNIEGMLPFENEIAQYIEDNPNNHVLYRVTPIFDGGNLVASGVQLEAFSVEDKGKGICFNIYCYNVEPGIIIDYKTGESYLDE